MNQYKWLLIALGSAGVVGVYHGQSRSVGTATTDAITVYAISRQSCTLEQQKADQLVAELERAGVNYTLHYLDQDKKAEAEFSQKIIEFLQKRGTSGNFTVRFPVVAVRETLLFNSPSLAQIQKHQ
ncbi:MAG: hypothetical protein Q6K90_01665 [Gloeomargarita sp. HHBFW_bins_162]